MSRNARREPNLQFTLGLSCHSHDHVWTHCMKVKKVRLGNINVQSLNSVVATPSFDTSLTTQILVKNTNWGPYKFDASIATFQYQGVNALHQKNRCHSEFEFQWTLPSNSNLGTEWSTGVLTLSSQAKLTGKVKLMFIMKKKKSAIVTSHLICQQRQFNTIVHDFINLWQNYTVIYLFTLTRGHLFSFNFLLHIIEDWWKGDAFCISF